MAASLTARDCGCTDCRAGEHPERVSHRQLDLRLTRLDEQQQRRWVAAHEVKRLVPRGFQRVAEITGLHPETTTSRLSKKVGSMQPVGFIHSVATRTSYPTESSNGQLRNRSFSQRCLRTDQS